MTRFTKVRSIFIAVSATLLLAFILETRFIKISGWTSWIQLVNKNGSNVTLTATEVTNKSRRLRLCTFFKGRLGNQMFIYASAYGIARAKGRTLIAPRNPLHEVFEGMQADRDWFVCAGFRPHKEKRGCAFDPQTIEFDDDVDVLLSGYLQSWMYFKNYYTEIRDLFTFKRPILAQAQKILEETKREYLAESGTHENNLTIVGIHVRRGDMVNRDLVKVGYRTGTIGYFNHAMDYFTRRYNNILFVVCSDSIAWCRKNLPRKKNIKIASGGTPPVDMAILSLCNHTIQSSGSFSWWSAWLAGGETTYFAYPAAEGSSLRKSFSRNFSDYFWPGWIPLT